MRKIIFFFNFCLILISVSCTFHIQPAPSWEVEDQEDYRIAKGDILEIITWKEPDFSREVPVRIDGKVNFPLLDDIQAEGRTCGEIKEDIQTCLTEFITHPVVSVAVKIYGSQKFYIIGEVLKPGEYPLNKILNILQTFALAGGFTEWASKEAIILIRNEDGKDKILEINYENIINGEELEKNLRIKADDIIVVP